MTTGSPEIVIAVVDSGVDPAHPDLQDAVLPGYDFVDGRPGATPVDGHGTAVAGTAAARARQRDRRRWRVLPLQRACHSRCVGRERHRTQRRHRRGHRLRRRPRGGRREREPHRPELAAPAARPQSARARAAGVLVVAAAGNDARDNPQFPAAVPGTISVGAVAPDGRRASFSSHGSWVKFAAPECAPIALLGGGSGIGCGTSMSAPLVAGIIALIRAQAPFATTDDIDARLARTARAVPGTVFGVPDAAAALRLVGAPEPRLRPVLLGDASVGSELEGFSGIWVGSGVRVELPVGALPGWGLHSHRGGNACALSTHGGRPRTPPPDRGHCGRDRRGRIPADARRREQAPAPRAPHRHRRGPGRRPAGRVRLGRWTGENLRFDSLLAAVQERLRADRHRTVVSRALERSRLSAPGRSSRRRTRWASAPRSAHRRGWSGSRPYAVSRKRAASTSMSARAARGSASSAASS